MIKRTSFLTVTNRVASRSLLATLIVTSLAGQAVAQSPQPAVNLRSSANFVVLGASLISNIPTSSVTGDVGLSPATGGNITGFGPLEVVGVVYAVDASGPAGSVPDATRLTAAKGDLTTAYNDAVGRTPVPSGPFLNPDNGTGNIGGQTLVPGLYKFTSSLAITGSNLTLAGGANDVWIFQIASNLNVGNGIQVILSGGARAANIFWQVGTSAILGTTSAFKGTILADQSVSMNSGASLEGRALARIAAVTLSANTITHPGAATTNIAAHSAKGRTFLRHDANGNLVFTVLTSGFTTVTLYDQHGRVVGVPFKGMAIAGQRYTSTMNTKSPSRGIYFVKLENNGSISLQKTILNR
jgi:hypothetical protein